MAEVDLLDPVKMEAAFSGLLDQVKTAAAFSGLLDPVKTEAAFSGLLDQVKTAAVFGRIDPGDRIDLGDPIGLVKVAAVNNGDPGIDRADPAAAIGPTIGPGTSTTGTNGTIGGAIIETI